MEKSPKTEHIVIDIPEMSLDYNDQNLPENIKAAFDKLQATFAS